MANFFFDAHFHPTLKKHFANPNEQPDPGTLSMNNPWKTALRRDFLSGFRLISIRKCLIKPLVENSLVSQSSLSQLRDSNYKLSIVVLFTPDKGLLELITKNKGFMDIVKSGKFKNLLIDTQFLDLVETNDAFSVLKKDLAFLEMSDITGDRVIKLNKRAEFTPTPNDLPRIVFSIEGLHCLRSDLAEIDEEKIVEDILNNLDELLTHQNKVIYVNLTHIDNGNTIFANQAYAVDAFRLGGFDEKHLRPIGNGFTPLGQRLVAGLANRLVIPDVKHMSWKARQQFYGFVQANFPNLPIICSHSGFTGCWFNKHGESIRDYILSSVIEGKQRKITLAKPTKTTIEGVGFNASSINLFNEDIEAIFKSNGLIGIALDQRVLGYSEVQLLGNEVVSDNIFLKEVGGLELKLVTDTEFISLNEIGSISPYSAISSNNSRLIECIQTEDITTQNSTDIKNFFHPRHFYLHVVHAMQIAHLTGTQQGGISGAEAAVRRMLTETLCIGSDFDGLIDGLDCCPDTGAIASFRAKFVDEFGDFMEEAGVSLPGNLTIDFVAERIFYKNGRDFVLRRLDAMNALSIV